MRIRGIILPAIAAAGTAGLVMAGSAAASAGTAPGGTHFQPRALPSPVVGAPTTITAGPKFCFCIKGNSNWAGTASPGNEWYGPKGPQGPKAIVAGPKM